MKAVSILTFVMAAIWCQGQELKDAPDKRSTTFVIEMEGMTAEDAYKRAATVLMDYGWQIANSDAMLQSLNTNWVKMKGFFVREWQANAMVRESDGIVRVYLKATVRANNMDAMPLEQRTNTGKDWIELKKIALLIGNKIKYL